MLDSCKLESPLQKMPRIEGKSEEKEKRKRKRPKKEEEQSNVQGEIIPLKNQALYHEDQKSFQKSLVGGSQ